jgi:hypothetical protein
MKLMSRYFPAFSLAVLAGCSTTSDPAERTVVVAHETQMIRAGATSRALDLLVNIALNDRGRDGRFAALSAHRLYLQSDEKTRQSLRDYLRVTREAAIREGNADSAERIRKLSVHLDRVIREDDKHIYCPVDSDRRHNFAQERPHFQILKEDFTTTNGPIRRVFDNMPTHHDVCDYVNEKLGGPLVTPAPRNSP